MSKRHETILRTAMIGDAADIARIYIATWRATYHGIVADHLLRCMDLRRETRDWRASIGRRDPLHHVLVVERGVDGMIGFATFGAERVGHGRRRGEIHTLYVLPRHQGEGHGRRLMAGAAEQMQADGFGDAVLWVLKENQLGRRFYERMGGSFGGERGTRLGNEDLRLISYEWSSLAALEGRAAGLDEIAIPDRFRAIA